MSVARIGTPSIGKLFFAIALDAIGKWHFVRNQ